MSSAERPLLVASDFDGTLLRSDFTVSQRSRDALASVVAAGSHLVIVTGRPPRWMDQVVSESGHTGVALVCNGAAVYDLASQRILRVDAITPEQTAEMIELIAGAVPDAAFAGEGVDGMVREAAYRTVFEGNPDVRLVSRAELSAQPLLKILVRSAANHADGLLAAALSVVGEHLGTLTHSSREGLLEISAAGVSKASALDRLGAELGISAADAVAFGDMPNDIPMLRWAGRSWAVGNAHPEVLAAATGVTKSNDDDGVAIVLEGFFR